jgi:hypothetical protein
MPEALVNCASKVVKIVYLDQDFKGAARAVLESIRRRGFDVSHALIDVDTINRRAVAALEKHGPNYVDLMLAGPKLGILCFLSHGGWDGPFTFSAPVPPGVVLAPGGLVVAIACHSAGSNYWERSGAYARLTNHVWVQKLATEVGHIYAVGEKGATNAIGDATRFIDYAFDGTKAPQEMGAYGPGGVPMKWVGWPPWVMAKAMSALPAALGTVR